MNSVLSRFEKYEKEMAGNQPLKAQICFELDNDDINDGNLKEKMIRMKKEKD